MSVSLITLSGFLYLLYYVIYTDVHSIMTWFLLSAAFLPINILIVTFIIEGIISARDKRLMLKKLNMVIGVFYSEVGTVLLKLLTPYNTNSLQSGGDLDFNSGWTRREYDNAVNIVKNYDYKIESRAGDLTDLKVFLGEKRDFLLRLLENPNLLEHETFTDLLWAVFHLNDELAHRKSLTGLHNADYNHISNDIKRAYTLLLTEWLSYMSHLKSDYPYLYSLAVRTNPFDPDASPEIKE
ncbi:hypothetical protein ACOBQJ_07800 [Pelotomaculum propionicicum]|uniref:hypothetical protein n=1 Tax=Pelotomaculum propionicicum TaxID=258475 RepID=UPI003B79EE38